MLFLIYRSQLAGFGLYLPSNSYGDDNEVFNLYQSDKNNIPYIKNYPSKGRHLSMEDPGYILEATKRFRENYFTYSNNSVDSVENIVSYIREELITKRRLLEDGNTLWQKCKILPLLTANLSLGSIEAYFISGSIDKGAFQLLINDLKTAEGKINNFLDSEGILERVLAFLPAFKKQKSNRLLRYLKELPLNDIPQSPVNAELALAYLAKKLVAVKALLKVRNNWENWKTANSIVADPPLTLVELEGAEHNHLPYFYDELEKGIRYDMFNLANHYWEGRWIMDTSKVIRRNGFRSDYTEKSAKERWHRFSMLTPCFVSTFYMAPKFFTYKDLEFSRNTLNSNPPLLNFIDLLIVDEAGQVTPEVGAATFALAKRGLIVGDSAQIEPVFSVGPKIDYANLQRNKVVEDMNDFDAVKLLNEKGFLCSSGSIIKLAQKSSYFHSNQLAERGMLLVEHRRCWDEIIEYCNLLAYQGLLVPKKGIARNPLMPPMQFIPSKGISSKVNGASNANQEEADQIADWILNNKEKIVLFYQNQEDTNAHKIGEEPKTVGIEKILGVITPFKAQQLKLETALRRKGIRDIVIGTVHAFQGAERDIILFSSTYGENEKNIKYFFDSGVNMLNVAVSRAKDTFIMFGCPGNYAKSPGTNKADITPSELLYSYINNVNS